ncbi:uncharacterized protein [Panulirus ornatus]|uniref:uncharacterized protein isoform X2 n=1 Tax=Panulirus ornatus TaxID=150431 RepID=UPI003A8576C0
MSSKTGGGRKRSVKNSKVAHDAENEDEPVVKKGRTRAQKVLQVDKEPDFVSKYRAAERNGNAKVKIELDSGDAENKQNAVFNRRGRSRRNKVKQGIEEEDNNQKPSSSNGAVAEQTKIRSKASKKDAKDNQKAPNPGKIPGGEISSGKFNASKKKKGLSSSGKGKENMDTNNAPVKPVVKSGVDRVVVMKGRAPVDALCPIAKQSHVFEEDDDIWDCMLNQVT